MSSQLLSPYQPPASRLAAALNAYRLKLRRDLRGHGDQLRADRFRLSLAVRERLATRAGMPLNRWSKWAESNLQNRPFTGRR